MIAVDTNILVYAHRREAAEHERARAVIAGLAEGAEPWAIAWPCVHEFFSVVTNPRIWKDAASSPDEAWAQLSAWFGAPGLRLFAETDEYVAVLGSLARRPRVRGPIIHDARVVAICLVHGVEKLFSRDRDFSLFPELVVEDPLR